MDYLDIIVTCLKLKPITVRITENLHRHCKTICKPLHISYILNLKKPSTFTSLGQRQTTMQYIYPKIREKLIILRRTYKSIYEYPLSLKYLHSIERLKKNLKTKR